MTDLSLIPVEDLIDEIMKRNDDVILYRAQKCDNESLDMHPSFKGNYFTCIGLCEKMKQLLLEDFDETQSDIKT